MKRTPFKLFCLLGLLGIGACQNNPSVLSTRLEHIKSGALVRCDPYLDLGDAQTPHSCLALVNPFQPMVRVFDVTEGEFLLAPIGYSPLAVRVDGMTIQLASLEQDSAGAVFAVDGNRSKIAALSTRNRAGVPSFSVVQPPPLLSLVGPVQQSFVVTDAQNQTSVLAALDNGHVNIATFDLSTFLYGAVQDIDLGLNGRIIDSAFDSASGVIAFLVKTVTSTEIVLRKAADIIAGNPGASHVVSGVGNVKIAIGSINTSTQATPHLLIMDQDTPKLSIKRLDPTILSETWTNDLTLVSSVTKAYFPGGANKNTCCNGKTEWLSLASDTGAIYYLSAEDLQDTEKDKTFAFALDIAADAGVPRDTVRDLVGFFGGDTIPPKEKKSDGTKVVCPRQIYFLYSTGFVGSVCEGYPGGVSVLVMR